MKTRSLLLCGALVAAMLSGGCTSLGQLSTAMGTGMKTYQGTGSGLVGIVGDAHIWAGKTVAGDVSPAASGEAKSAEKK